MKALLGGVVVAEATEGDLVRIEGNWYFPPQSITASMFEKSDTPYHCPWKGDCQYFNVRTGDTMIADGAWSYPDPIPSSFERVGQDYSDFVAFGNEVHITP
ncbi:MAG TPA: DUF427 domain-containing protein [Aeromicrobium sp.]|nr:DUF427 domain-containing protein [Aeromicrobium sp.]